MSNKYPGGLITSGANAGYSVFFDGSGDYLTLASNAAFGFGTGSLTVEFWMYPTALGTITRDLIDFRQANTTTPLTIQINSSNTVFVYNGSAQSSTGTATLNTWSHVAFVRNGSACVLYLNGVSVSSFTDSGDYRATNPVSIGTNQYSTGEVFQGYLSNIRVVKGTALYTAAFTPPTQLFNVTNTSLLTCNSPAIIDQSSNAFTITANGDAKVSTFTPFTGYTAYNPALGAATPGIWTVNQAIQAAQTRRWNMYDPYFNNTTLLLHGNYTGSVNSSGTAVYQNNNFLDSSSNNFSITRNGNTTQGTFSPFSQTGWSNYFNNSAGGTGASSGNYLTTNVAAISSVGASDFSIECFVYALQQTQTTAQGLVSYGIAGSTTGTSYLSLELSSTGYLGCAYATATSTTVTDPALFPINQWVHVVVCRSGSTLSLYVNGIRKATATTSATVGSTGDGLVIGGQWYDASKAGRDLNGYMSNVRIVKGSSAYDATQSTLTVPTSPLTAITNTSLLTCQSNRFVDNSSNGYAISVFSNVQTSVQAFSPFLTNVAYTPQVQGGSGYFDGTGDYLSIADNTAFNLSTGAWTIEAFVYPTTVASRQVIIGKRVASGGFVISWYLEISATGQVQFTNAAGSYTSSASTVKANSWGHIAASYDGANLSLYYNGTRVYGPSAVTCNDSTANIYIGGSSIDSFYLNGWASGVRVVKGTAVYSGASITVPTSPLTAISGTSLLTNFTNAGIVDSTGKNVLETVGDAKVSTTQSKFGGYSMYFDGTGDWLLGPSTQNCVWGTGDFTIEFWCYPTTLNASTDYNILDFRDSNDTGSFRVGINGTTIPFLANSVGGVLNGSYTFTTNNWYHFAVTRRSGTLTIWINGTSAGSNTTTTNFTGSKITVGAAVNNTGPYFGYLDDIRVTKGYARYTAAFTPQTSQWQDQ